MMQLSHEDETISFNPRTVTSIACEKDDETNEYKFHVTTIHSTGTVTFEGDKSDVAKTLFKDMIKQLQEGEMIILSNKDFDIMLNPQFVTRVTLHENTNKGLCHIIFETINTLDSHVITCDTIEKGQEMFEQYIKDVERTDDDAKFVKVKENDNETVAINAKFIASIVCEKNAEENNWYVQISSIHSIFPDKFTFKTESDAKKFFQNILEQIRN